MHSSPPRWYTMLYTTIQDILHITADYWQIGYFSSAYKIVVEERAYEPQTLQILNEKCRITKNITYTPNAIEIVQLQTQSNEKDEKIV